MPRGYPSLAQEQKQEIISRIKEKGERAADLSKEYGVVPKTIYNLLSRSVQGSSKLLELAKLKRELGHPGVLSEHWRTRGGDCQSDLLL